MRVYFIMEHQKVIKSISNNSQEVTNKNYLELLEKHILLDKTIDLDNKHKEWSRSITD